MALSLLALSKGKTCGSKLTSPFLRPDCGSKPAGNSKAQTWGSKPAGTYQSLEVAHIRLARAT